MDFNFMASSHPTAPQYPVFSTLPTPDNDRSYAGFFCPELPMSASITAPGSDESGVLEASHLLPGRNEPGAFEASHLLPNPIVMAPGSLHKQQTTPSSRLEVAVSMSQEVALHATSASSMATEKPTSLQTRELSKNASKNAAKVRKAARESFELDFDRLMQKLKQDIGELAEKHNKKETHIESMVFNGGTNYLCESKASAWNAWLHHKYQEVNDGE